LATVQNLHITFSLTVIIGERLNQAENNSVRR